MHLEFFLCTLKFCLWTASGKNLQVKKIVPCYLHAIYMASNVKIFFCYFIPMVWYALPYHENRIGAYLILKFLAWHRSEDNRKEKLVCPNIQDYVKVLKMAACRSLEKISLLCITASYIML
jgi:hypothetical protein